jgi:hypothetical protein
MKISRHIVTMVTTGEGCILIVVMITMLFLWRQYILEEEIYLDVNPCLQLWSSLTEAQLLLLPFFHDALFLGNGVTRRIVQWSNRHITIIYIVVSIPVSGKRPRDGQIYNNWREYLDVRDRSNRRMDKAAQ